MTFKLLSIDVFSGIIFLVFLVEPFEQAKTTTQKPKTGAVQTYRTLICEHVTAVIVCPNNMEINVLWADYGRWNNYTCPNELNLASDSNVNCRSGATAQGIVMKACNGKKSCSLPSWFQFMNNNVDPCGGTWKYVNMTHQCVVPKKSSTKPKG